MGNSAAAAWKAVAGQRETRLLMLGLDAAGKTTILYKMKLGEVKTMIPTIGFNIEQCEYVSRAQVTSFTTWDVGGRDKIRPLWRHFYKDTDGLIFVIDSNDRDRLEDARIELDQIMGEEELKNCPILIFANKQDLPNSMKVQEIVEGLGLNALRGRQWYIQPSVATSGDGIYEGLDWVTKAVRQHKEGGPAAAPPRDAQADELVAQLKELRKQQAKLTGPAAPAAGLRLLKGASADGDESGAETDSTADTDPDDGARYAALAAPPQVA